MAISTKLIGTSLEKKMLKQLPPLKDYPADSDDSEMSINSERSDVLRKKMRVEREIKQFKDEFVLDPFLDLTLKNMEQVFIRLAKLKSYKTPNPKWEVIDYLITEKSLRA